MAASNLTQNRKASDLALLSGPAKRRKRVSSKKDQVHINTPPSDILRIFVFGDGELGTLGLGSKHKSAHKPKLNPFLDPSNSSGLKVVQLDCGSLHVVALTKDNQIVTWGVNDNHALGRDTAWGGETLRDMDVDSSSDDDDEDLNPLEATPTAIPASFFPPGTEFAQVAAADNLSLALTTTGEVYGWGTFRSSDGQNTFGYDAAGGRIEVQKTPVPILGLTNITQIACGSDHCLALSSDGQVFSWGIPDEHRLGRRLSPRFSSRWYTPTPILGSIKAIYTGERHSFAITSGGDVWSWGLNSHGQTGSNPQEAGSTNFFHTPRQICKSSYFGEDIKLIAAGASHSAIVTKTNKCLLWGRMDCGQLGINFTKDQLDNPYQIIRDERKNEPLMCLRPTPLVAELTGDPDHVMEVLSVACGEGHTVFVNTDGKAFSSGWGFLGQLGHQRKRNDADVTTTAQPIKFKGWWGGEIETKFNWAGAGTNFSLLAEVG